MGSIVRAKMHSVYMRALTKCLKALANERRLLILRELARREPLTINTIAKRIALSLKSTSKHVQKLVDCDLLERTQKASFVWCKLNRTHKILRALFPHLRK